MNKIIYSNKKNTEKIIDRIKKDGVSKLHLLADFDRTLTYSLVNGEKKPSLISVIRSNPKYLGESYSKKANEMFDYYHPIETSTELSIEEKTLKMTEWWQKHLELLVSSGLKKEHIDDVVNSGIIKMRKGVVKYFNFLKNNNIPLIIMSANALGLDSIKDYFIHNNLLSDNIEIVSNSFIFDENGKTIGYNDNVIHVFNKGEIVLSKFPKIKEKIKERKNIILLGDSLGDPHMADGVDYENILKIGFYNEKDLKNIDYYKEKYDILLTGDSDGDFLNNVLTLKS